MADTLAYNLSQLTAKVEGLPISFIVLADNGYRPTEKLVTPYCGAEGQDPDNATFNFYLSQLRIRIEMCFGLLTAKWRILRENQEGSIETITKVIEACLLLHNFVIERGALYDNEVFGEVSDAVIRAHIRNCTPPAERNNGDTVVRVPLEPIEGVSQTRDALRDFIKSRGYIRPGHNVARNAGRGIDH
jgi:DDE superfamily endonuclease